MLVLKALPQVLFDEMRNPNDVMNIMEEEFVVPPICVCKKENCKCKTLFTGINSSEKTTLARIQKVEEEVLVKTFLNSFIMDSLIYMADTLSKKGTKEEIVKSYIWGLASQLMKFQENNILRTLATPTTLYLLPWYSEDLPKSQSNIIASQNIN